MSKTTFVEFFIPCDSKNQNLGPINSQTLLTFGVAALVYIGSWTLAGMDLTVGVSLVFSAGIVLASALAGSGVLVALGGGSDGSCYKCEQVNL